MRLVAGLLALTLTGSLAFAEEAKAPDPQPEPARTKVTLRVVKILPESHQALLYDKIRGTHVLADVGSSIGDYRVEAIEDDEVTLSAGGREIVLAAGVEIARSHSAPASRRADAAPANPYGDDEEAPVDPYGDAVALDAGPADPYVDTDLPEDPYGDAPVRVAEAPRPINAGEGGVRVANAAGDAPAPTPSPAPTPPHAATTPAVATMPAVVTVPDPRPTRAKPGASKGTPAPSADEFAAALTGEPTPPTEPAVATKAPTEAAPASEPAPTRDDGAIVLAKKDVKAALADFGALTGAVRGAFTPAGARIDYVTPGSVFAKAGLRGGDVVTSVDGAPLRSIDDAADLYIRASTLRTSTVQVIRDGKPITLRLAIK